MCVCFPDQFLLVLRRPLGKNHLVGAEERGRVVRRRHREWLLIQTFHLEVPRLILGTDAVVGHERKKTTVDVGNGRVGEGITVKKVPSEREVNTWKPMIIQSNSLLQPTPYNAIQCIKCDVFLLVLLELNEQRWQCIRLLVVTI
jgi:hypothetical protein